MEIRPGISLLINDRATDYTLCTLQSSTAQGTLRLTGYPPGYPVRGPLGGIPQGIPVDPRGYEIIGNHKKLNEII